MGRANFEKLEVYHLSEELADAIWNIVKSWGEFSKETIGKQIVRSADSIGANIAEGVGRSSFQDNRRFVRIARGSLNETIHWLRRCHKRDLLNSVQTEELRLFVDKLGPKLNAYLKPIGRIPIQNRHD